MANISKLTKIFEHPTDSTREINVEIAATQENFDVFMDFNPNGNQHDYMGHLFDNGEIASGVWDRPKIAR
jgi:hypothetical protein